MVCFLYYNYSDLTLPASSCKFHVLSMWAHIWTEQIINSHRVGVMMSIAAAALLTLRIFPNKWSIDIKAEPFIICGIHSFCSSNWFLKWYHPVYCSELPNMLFGQALNVIQLIRQVSLGMQHFDTELKRKVSPKNEKVRLHSLHKPKQYSISSRWEAIWQRHCVLHVWKVYSGQCLDVILTQTGCSWNKGCRFDLYFSRCGHSREGALRGQKGEDEWLQQPMTL